MEKVLNFSLASKDWTLPDLPWLHDYELSEIIVKENKIILTSEDFDNHDYDYSDITGFHPKKVTVEFFHDSDAIWDTQAYVYVVYFRSKKQIRERNKFGYGARVNCYEIEDFATIHKNYCMMFKECTVGANKAVIKFAMGRAKEIFIEFFCNCVKYVFTD